MVRRRLIAGNWKMNLATAAAVSLAESAMSAAAKNENHEVAVFPSFVSLRAVYERTRGSAVAVGAQDVFWKESGAYTGEVSPAMLADAGCKYCIVGHSERRGRFGVADDSPAGFFSDTNEAVNRKISALVFAGIAPILCVGETKAERESERTIEVIDKQILECLAGIESDELVIAYEPVWAIGTGEVCDAAEAERMCGYIHSRTAFGNLRVLYGGSVKADNAAELFSMPSIDGGLVGGASLKANEFTKIIEAK
ncbi:MAG: triose-phosphate isomerase [Fimbriimonadales bacterium]